MSTRHRFDLRKDSEFTWEIFDTTTGRTVVIDGKRYCDLPLDSADIMVDLMNSEGIEPDEEAPLTKPKRENRYAMRRETDDSWTVYDIFTGLPAEVTGIPQDHLDMEVADDLVHLLNAEYIARRGGTAH